MKSYSYQFLVFYCIVLLGCKKTTSISGIVRNSADNQPLQGVLVRLGDIGFAGGTISSTAFDSDSTGIDGSFSLEISSKGGNSISLGADKTGFIPFVEFVSWGKCLEKDITINPIDSWLKLTLQNNYCQSGKLYWVYTSPLWYFKRQGVPGIDFPIIIPQGNSREFLFKVPGGGTTHFIWDTLIFGTKEAPRIDSIFCTRYDTTEYTLKF